MAQCIECWLVNQRVIGSIPSLEHMPGLWARSPFAGTREATTHCCFSPSLSPSLPLSKNKYKIFKNKTKNLTLGCDNMLSRACSAQGPGLRASSQPSLEEPPTPAQLTLWPCPSRNPLPKAATSRTLRSSQVHQDISVSWGL